MIAHLASGMRQLAGKLHLHFVPWLLPGNALPGGSGLV